MNGEIEITYAERQAADKAVHRVLVEGSGGDLGVFARILVGAVLKAIDEVRVGDPVGTVRRYDGGNSVAIRRGYGWLLVHEDHIEELKPHTRLHLPQWPLVYIPEESA